MRQYYAVTLNYVNDITRSTSISTFLFPLLMIETRTVFILIQRSSTTNLSRFKDEIDSADHLVANLKDFAAPAAQMEISLRV
jgi:hypothetical protein